MGETREQKVIRQLSGKPTEQKFTPIATDMFLPNHSGDHSAGIVNRTPTTDTDIANKKYVDDHGGVTDHTALSNIGTNTHAQIDTHIGDSSDPHGATLTQTTLNATTINATALHTTGSHSTELRIDTDATTNVLSAVVLKAKTSGQMENTFGVGMIGVLEDADATANIAGGFSCVRRGADNTADMVLIGSEGGTNYEVARGSITSGVKDFLVPGVLRAAGQSSAIAYLSANQSINTASWTLVAANTEIQDTRGEYDTANYKFTPASLTGNYMVFANIYFSTMAAGDVMAVAIYLNGSMYNQTRNIAGIAGDYSLGISAIVPATAKFEIYVYHTHGSARNILGTQTYSTTGFNRLN